ncbi:MAG: cytochrome c3 family protein [SAR202 cluster bacterium]|nr:cytochrome c3 family protein [SAR202 cluster bacterium]MDP6663490.1 cytochrome c3 family protein [SAR202 cluster bacterium]MDP6799850.1 cytochrome c3 family protein [SAR202 cluster bacterium]
MAVGDGLAEVEKLRTTFEAGDPIDWVRVHRQPDHVRFVHEAHISFFSEQDGVAPSGVCSTCHGDVGAMDVVKQVEPLKMSQCVDCHRDNGAPTDCTTCHY